RSEIVGGHAAVDAVEERVGSGQAANAGEREISRAEREPFVEHEADIAGRRRHQRGARREQQDIEIQPWIEGIPGKVKDVACQLMSLRRRTSWTLPKWSVYV